MWSINCTARLKPAGVEPLFLDLDLAMFTTQKSTSNWLAGGHNKVYSLYICITLVLSTLMFAAVYTVLCSGSLEPDKTTYHHDKSLRIKIICVFMLILQLVQKPIYIINMCIIIWNATETTFKLKHFHRYNSYSWVGVQSTCNPIESVFIVFCDEEGGMFPPKL